MSRVRATEQFLSRRTTAGLLLVSDLAIDRAEQMALGVLAVAEWGIPGRVFFRGDQDLFARQALT